MCPWSLQAPACMPLSFTSLRGPECEPAGTLYPKTGPWATRRCLVMKPLGLCDQLGG